MFLWGNQKINKKIKKYVTHNQNNFAIYSQIPIFFIAQRTSFLQAHLKSFLYYRKLNVVMLFVSPKFSLEPFLI